MALDVVMTRMVSGVRAIVILLLGWLLVAFFWWFIGRHRSMPIWQLSILPGGMVGGATMWAFGRWNRASVLLISIGCLVAVTAGDFLLEAKRMDRLTAEAGVSLPLSTLARMYIETLPARWIELSAAMLIGLFGGFQSAAMVAGKKRARDAEASLR